MVNLYLYGPLARDSADGYRTYLRYSESGQFVAYAEEKLREKAWGEAQKANEPEKYLDYYAEYPNSPHITVDQGVLVMKLAYSILGGSASVLADEGEEFMRDSDSSENSMLESSGLWIGINGEELRILNSKEIIKFGLYRATKEGFVILRAGNLRATVLREKKSGDILAIRQDGPYKEN